MPNLSLIGDGRAAGSPTARLGVAAAFIWLVLSIAAVLLVLREREATIERVARNFAALTLVLEGHAARTLQAVDLTLAGAVDALRLADDLPPHDPEFQAALERRLEFLTPYARAIYVVDASGRIIHDTDYPAIPAIAPAGRPYFRRHREDPTLIGTVASPLENHPELGWFVPVTRRLGTGQEFSGVAVAAVQPRYFEDLYQRLGLGASEIISLYYESGVLISQYPESGLGAGSSYGHSALFRDYLPHEDAGTFVTADAPLFYERLVSYRKVDGQPLVVAVTQNMQAVLAPWRVVAMGAGVALLVLLILLTLLVDQFRRQQDAQQRAQERHAKAERMQALGHFTSGVAHDFNNLLGVVSSSLAVIAHEGSERDARRDAMTAAERAVDRGAELIRRLGTFARNRPIRVIRANLSDSIRHCAELLQRAAGSNIELSLDLAEDLPECLLDETEFEVALVNLVVNARDAMAGAGRIAIRSCRGEDEDRVCVEVEDSGHGMSEQVQRHAFEPYYTTKGDQGTGLGLAQVYGFMLQVGGDARVESRPGIGTRVELQFRIASASD